MDTSQQYVEMCRKAIELQNEWKPLADDQVYFNNEITIVAFNEQIFTKIRDNLVNKTMKVIWLPRQDQLQDIYPGKEMSVYHYLVDIARFNDEFNTYSLTMENFLLQYVMFKKFKKAWNGKNWVG